MIPPNHCKRSIYLAGLGMTLGGLDLFVFRLSGMKSTRLQANLIVTGILLIYSQTREEFSLHFLKCRVENYLVAMFLYL